MVIFEEWMQRKMKHKFLMVLYLKNQVKGHDLDDFNLQFHEVQGDVNPLEGSKGKCPWQFPN